MAHRDPQGGLIVLSSASLLLAVLPTLPLAVCLVIVIVTFGVVLPAVWSRKPKRREAAREVLVILLTRGRQPGSGRSQRQPRRLGRRPR